MIFQNILLKRLIFALILFQSTFMLAQTNEKLYYFSTADSSKVGAKTESGKIIVPAKFSNYGNYDFKEPIEEATIEFIGTEKAKDYSSKLPLMPAGEVYDRHGKFLYYPQWFDNGVDYYEEGLRRYVDGNKVGFADKDGKLTIPAQWDFAEPFQYGYAKVYVGGWKKQYEKGGEHWFIVPSSKKSQSYLINKKGEKVNGYKTKKNPKDYESSGLYYPYPFTYTSIEQKVLDNLTQLDILNSINLASCDNCIRKEHLLDFEITEKPRDFFPYYVIQGYVNQSKESDAVFIVSTDMSKIYHYSWDGEITPLREWIISELEEFKTYFETHPNKPNYFDVQKSLQYWKNLPDQK
ncbi:WG repeat-containing protein [Soonwooa sp.]|uniref:WG repeat-containing protein n=1 Tax=Soonwooa sp. TaxID=1938592 RepID=UPI0035AF5704